MTPREVLLNRHRQAGPRLDAVRREVVRGIGRGQSGRRRVGWCLPFCGGWADVVLATAWLLMVLLRVGMPETVRSAAGSRAGLPMREMAQNVRENRRQLQETLEPAPEVEPPKPVPAPRSSLGRPFFNT